MTFAQALARIEELIMERDSLEGISCSRHKELLGLLDDSANSIVQLGKIAKQMRNCCVEIRDQHYDSLDNHLCLKTDWVLRIFDVLIQDKE